ncbi:MAG: GntR family transcriptional regulator [Acidobacteria bacterium]|nr:GntR family transcriptional regulator [Acidobacteriota bacterium]
MSSVTQAERVYHEIRQRILEAHYRPGTHYSEAVLARVHHASRTPVREALGQLLEQGYVEHEVGRGWSVAPVTLARIRDTFEVRRLLETAGAARAAELATEAEVTAMRALAADATEVNDRESYLAALARNLRFHLAVAAASHNEMLVDLVHRCLTHMDRVLALGIDYTPFQEVSSAHHQAIVDAIAARDAVRAHTAMAQHVDESGDLLMRAVVSGAVRGVEA